MNLRCKHTAALSLLVGTLCGCAGRGGTVAEEGLILISPPSSTRESRSQDINKCLSAAVEIARATRLLTLFESMPLRGQSTGQFLLTSTLSGPKPYVDSEGSPARAPTAVFAGLGQSPVSDRYVICLLAKGYEWPNSIATKGPENPNSGASPEQETASLYEAAWRYRHYGGAPQEAERLLRRAVAIDEKRLPDSNPIMVQDLGELAIALLEQKRIDDGVPYVNRLLPNADHAKGHLRNFQAWIFEHYAAALTREGNSEYIAKLSTTAKQLRSQ
jgi:hypothetical protein